jgi:hypothetical protein
MFAAPVSLVAQDFRVETQVYAGSDPQPYASNLTLFAGGAAYDFALASDETTVFDPAHERFALLDTKRKVRTELNLAELGKYTEDLRAKERLKSKEPFLFDPRFKVSYAAASRRLTLDSPVIVYRAVGIAPPAEQSSAVGMFGQFADWSLRLNATHARSFPPFARMELNRELQQRGLVPEQVELEFTPSSDPSQKAVYRSRQTFAWTLTDEDQRRIELVARQLLEFTPISFDAYRKQRP